MNKLQPGRVVSAAAAVAKLESGCGGVLVSAAAAVAELEPECSSALWSTAESMAELGHLFLRWLLRVPPQILPQDGRVCGEGVAVRTLLLGRQPLLRPEPSKQQLLRSPCAAQQRCPTPVHGLQHGQRPKAWEAEGPGN